MPTSPADRQTEPVDPPPAQLHRCPHCGERHQPVRLEAGGVFASYARQLVAEPGQRRPRPLGQTGDTTALVRDAFNPWRAHPAAEPPPPGTTLRERIAHLWYGDES